MFFTKLFQLLNHYYIITVVLNPTTDSISDSVWRCPKHYFWCNYNHNYDYNNPDCTHIDNYICDGGNHCINGIDEKYCDQTVSPSFENNDDIICKISQRFS